jgi:hypothetical protein
MWWWAEVSAGGTRSSGTVIFAMRARHSARRPHRTGASACRTRARRPAHRPRVRRAREAGHSWDQIGQALGVSPDTDRTGEIVAEAAYTYATGSSGTETAMRYGRSFLWRCPSCDQAIGDRGLIAGPADDEPGHADGCSRLAAAVAEWEAEP